MMRCDCKAPNNLANHIYITQQARGHTHAQSVCIYTSLASDSRNIIGCKSDHSGGATEWSGNDL